LARSWRIYKRLARALAFSQCYRIGLQISLTKENYNNKLNQMTKVTHYFCNMCQESKKENLRCMVYDGTIKVGDYFGAYKLNFDLNGSDKHICNACLEFIFNSMYDEKQKTESDKKPLNKDNFKT